MMFSRLVAPSIVVALSLMFTACAAPSPRKGPKLPVSTGAERPFVRDSLAPPDAVSPLYDEARAAFREGRFDLAARRFATYRNEASPGDPLADNALLGEGLAYFDQGRYDEAAQRFSALIAQWPDAETTPAAMINLALCRYWTGAWSEAKVLLKQAAQQTKRPAEMAYIAYYRAALAERDGDFFEAAVRSIDAERLAEDRDLVTLAREKVERLFHTFLSDAELEGFTHTFAGRWPAKVAWEELLLRYRRTGQDEKLARAKRVLASDFADEAASVGKLLADENAVISHPRIVVALPVSGAGSDAGRRMFQGAQLAANDYHELIRQLGVDMTMKDMGQTAESARRGVQESALDRKTIALLGPVTSASFQAVATTAHDYATPILSPAANQEGLASASSRLFRTVYLSSSEAENLAELAVTHRGLQRLVVLYEEGERGRRMTAYFREAVTRRGGTLVGVEAFAPDATDFSGQIKALGGRSDEAMREEILALAEANEEMTVDEIDERLARRYADQLSAPFVENYEELPLTKRNFRPSVRFQYDGVVMFGHPQKTGLLMGQLMFYNIRDLPRFVSSEANNPLFLRNAERFAEGVMMVDDFFADSARPAVKDFVRHYRIAFREQPDRIAAQSYDATRLLMAALARGVRTRREMTDYLRGVTDFPGVTGSLTMTPSGDVIRTPFYLTVKGGSIVEFDPRALPEEEQLP